MLASITIALLPEIARGKYPAPAWLILVLGGVIVLGASAFLLVRALVRLLNRDDR